MSEYANAKPLSGPCITCGAFFKSRGTKPRKYCSMDCYTSSPQWKEAQLRNSRLNAANRIGTHPDNWVATMKNCLQCNAEFRIKPGETKSRKYCSNICYRKYMADRFDRWIANPNEIALPQAFDEFLTNPVLRCLVKDCDWTGHHLSLHVNKTHGIPASHFKKLVGFNKGSGIVSTSLHKALSDRDIVGVALNNSKYPKWQTGVPQKKDTYRSLEGREHQKKTRALLGDADSNKSFICEGCSGTFKQNSYFGKTKFHSIECRNLFYKGKNKLRPYKLSCVVCGDLFNGSRQQYLSAQVGNPVVCGHSCKGKINGSKPKRRKQISVKTPN